MGIEKIPRGIRIGLAAAGLVGISAGLIALAQKKGRHGMGGLQVMPAVVPDSMDEVLAKFEKYLRDQAPDVLTELQPGLSEAEIVALEAKYGVKLVGDIRTLYKWRNGSNDRGINAVPNHRFVPLGEALEMRALLISQTKAVGPLMQMLVGGAATDKMKWVPVFVDLAGDGFHYDPSVREEAGAFFYNFLEVGEYVHYPSVRNYVAEVLAAARVGIVKVERDGLICSDYEKAYSIRMRYGRISTGS